MRFDFEQLFCILKIAFFIPVLPKFQVVIKPPSYIALGQSKVFGDICAK